MDRREVLSEGTDPEFTLPLVVRAVTLYVTPSTGTRTVTDPLVLPATPAHSWTR